MKQLLSIVFFTLMVVGCSENKVAVEISGVATAMEDSPQLIGKWIKEADGSIMLDPQTSGLAVRNGKLLSLSDGSGHESQRRRIHVIDPGNATLEEKTQVMAMSNRVKRSCFSAYLSSQPDLEALVVDPLDDTVFYVVTEDATRTGALSVRCQQQFANTGSTDYPTLLVRVKLGAEGRATMTHVRPLRFSAESQVGDFPNDGIEGMAITPDRTLFLGLEKDKSGAARIFSLRLRDTFWDSSAFVDVEEPDLLLPKFNSGNHPINALTWISFRDGHPGFLIAAARNDDEIWIIDLKAEKNTKRQSFVFASEIEAPSQCGDYELMDNASIEGLAVLDGTLWLINDPWKRNYLKNIVCQDNAANYEAMAPLLFSTPVDADWFL